MLLWVPTKTHIDRGVIETTVKLSTYIYKLKLMLLWVLIPVGVIETTVETVLSTSRDPTDKLLRCPRNIAARLA